MCCLLLQEWPEDKFPLRTVGRLVLDQNIDNFHNESEQIAFSPGLAPPGADSRPCPGIGYRRKYAATAACITPPCRRSRSYVRELTRSCYTTCRHHLQ